MKHQNPILNVEDLNIWYNDFHAVKNISIDYFPHTISAIIGPSGCGKSTYIRAINRIYEEVPGARAQGKIYYQNQNILSSQVDPVQLRQHIGMVFQKPNPFPNMSIFDNTVIGLKLNGQRNKNKLKEVCEKSLRQTGLWEEVKDRLHHPGLSLSGGQQQRLCIARSIALNPSIIIMDEPTSALDPIATNKIEKLMTNLKKNYTVIIVTHNMQQAARIADYTSFFVLGELIEHGLSSQIFTNPKEQKTEDYISGRFG